MRYNVVSLILGSLLPAAALTAQAAPTPAPQLAKFDRVVGSWQGSGTMIQKPGDEPMKWTASNTVKRAFGGHIVERDTTVEFGDAAPPVTMRALVGWDPDREQFKVCALSDRRPGSARDITWADDKTLVSVFTGLEDGQQVIERTVAVFGDDKYSLTIDRAVGSGDFYRCAEGNFERGKAPSTMEASFSRNATPAVAMGKVARMAGSYDFKGHVAAVAGQPASDVSGNITVRPGFGGSALEIEVSGAATDTMPAYEAWAAITWNPARNCYTVISANNMGELNTGEARWIDGNLVSTVAAFRHGEPTVGRTVLTLGDDGSMAKAVSHGIAGTGEPRILYTGVYEKR